MMTKMIKNNCLQIVLTILILVVTIISVSNVYSQNDYDNYNNDFVMILENSESDNPQIKKIRLNDLCKGGEECKFIPRNIYFSPPQPNDYKIFVNVDFRFVDSINENMSEKKRDLMEGYHMYPSIIETYNIFESTDPNNNTEIYYYDGIFNIYKSNTIGMPILSFDMKGTYSLPEQKLVIVGNKTSIY
jgi:hypothetical protein